MCVYWGGEVGRECWRLLSFFSRPSICQSKSRTHPMNKHLLWKKQFTGQGNPECSLFLFFVCCTFRFAIPGSGFSSQKGLNLCLDGNGSNGDFW